MVPKNTEKIVLFLLKNRNEYGYNINQLSKLNRISVGSAFKILKELEQENILSKKEISNASHYMLNLENPETTTLCELLLLGERRKLKGYAKLYAEDLMRFNDAEMILLFGSVLKGKEFNDVDVLFITNKIKRTNDFCLQITKTRRKPVVPLILRKEEFQEAVRQKKKPIIDLIKNGVLLAGEDLFVEMIRDALRKRL